MDTTVGSFGSRAEAELAKELLVGAGIPATIRADDAGGLHPELAQVFQRGGITLVVPPGDAEEARQLLAEPPPVLDDWEEPRRGRPARAVVAAFAVLVLVLAAVVAVEVLGLVRR